MMMAKSQLAAVAGAFGISAQETTPISEGLINHTFRVTAADGSGFIIQKLNTHVFSEPEAVQENFLTVHHILRQHYRLPELIRTASGALLLRQNGDTWRCFSFIDNSYTPTGTIDESLAYTTARCFGHYTAWLSAAPPALHTILPRFHDLSFRAEQLAEAKKAASAERLKMAAHWLNELDRHIDLLKHYERWTSAPRLFPQRILHHDAKASNILFDKNSGEVIGPIDLDTTQYGLFFSDLGDMMRSMVPNLGENDTHFADLEARPMFMQAILEGYLDSTHRIWTPQEREALPLSGKILLYMQAIRFLADFLNNDSYYQTAYETHNLDRAINQITVLNAWQS